MAPYQYKPLSSPNTQIRLLELLPGHGVIQCRLQITDFNLAKGTYEPISYCWNSYSCKGWVIRTYKENKERKSMRVVRVDGVGFQITRSLESALRQMRLNTGVRVLWVDAICINQADDDEKSAQVAIMAKIYKGGKQTLAWLGNADCWTGMAFKYFKRQISEDSNSTGIHEEPTDESEYWAGDPTAKSQDLRHLRRVWEIYQNLLSHVFFRSILDRPYFERAWIVQEIVLSSEVIFMCGKHEITAEELMYKGSHEPERILPPRAGLMDHSIWDLWDNRKLYCLDEIITKLSHTKTSDPRDKLYSALGLHELCTRCGSMVVDYSKDVDEVFLDATKLMLSQSSYLDLLSLSYCTSRPDERHVPSWVWNPQPRSTEFYFSWAEAYGIEPFTASKCSQSRPKFQGRLLGLLGYVFDRVDRVGKSMPAHPEHATHSFSSELLKSYFSWVLISGIHDQGIPEEESNRRMRSFHCTLEPLKEKFDRRDTNYSNRTNDKDTKHLVSFHEEIMKRFGKFFSPGENQTSPWARLELWTAIESLRWQLLGRTADAETRFKFIYSRRGIGAIFDRCFVRSAEGSYGLCPRDTVQNDRLVLLQGAKVPLVLRPSGQNWTLVGECYIYGAMHGEIWDQDRCEMLWIE